MPFSKVNDDVFLRIVLPRHLMTRIAQNKAVANQRRIKGGSKFQPIRLLDVGREISGKMDGHGHRPESLLCEECVKLALFRF